MFVLLLVRQQMAFVQFMGKFTKVLSNYGRIAYVRNQRLKNDISMNACWMSVKIMGSNYNFFSCPSEVVNNVKYKMSHHWIDR